MMRYLFYFIVSLFLVVLKTSVFAWFPLLDHIYDPLIIFVLFLGLNRPVGESLIFVIVSGLIMDDLSGGTFGLYTTTYFWLFAIVRILILYLRATSVLLLAALSAFGVFLENLIVFLTAVFLQTGSHFYAAVADIFLSQVVWAVITGPFLLLLISFAFDVWCGFFDNLIEERKDTGDYVSYPSGGKAR